MKRKARLVVNVLAWVLLAACAGRRSAVPTTSATLLPSVGSTTVAAPGTPSPTALPPVVSIPEGAYTSLDLPLAQRSDAPQAGVLAATQTGFSLYTGEYRLDFNNGVLTDTVMLTRPGQSVALALRPLGADLNLLRHVETVMIFDEPARTGVRLTGSAPWTEFAFWLLVYPHNPGLIRYRIELSRLDEPPRGAVDPEWTFVDPTLGEAAPAGYTGYADKASFASPSFYGYAQSLDSTLLHWVDVTRLNDFIRTTHYSPGSTPVRQGRSFGHNLTRTDLGRMLLIDRQPLYDSYLYLAPSLPAGEAEMFLRYLHQVSDIYDLIAHPVAALPDWQELARNTLKDLQDPDTWVDLNGKRYWRAYVSDTRQSAEAITQLDIAAAAARYVARYGADEAAQPILDDALAVLPDFYNPNFKMLQNSGPLAISGDQGRGDTWYELGHALKAAELGLMGYDSAAKLAQDSREAWMDFAQTVGHKFPRFYSFKTWKGTDREPDAAGGYALYMLRLADLGCGEPCVEEAQVAVRAFPGYGFSFAYETHMTAMAALAAAELADRTGDDSWLAYANGPIANLVRLSWVYEVDYGKAATAHTFFGLAPTQRAGTMTPKEQYEAWIYLSEFLRRAHGQIDPAVEKLVAEFCYRSLVMLADAFPPRLPAGVATQHPAAYETVKTNRLDLYIPLEDMRDGQNEWGAIGQEVYGAGLAPTIAALAYMPVASNITVYSGYPLAEINDTIVTLSGVPGTFAPVRVTGAGAVLDAQGNAVAVEPCGPALCFMAEGGGRYELRP